MQLLARNISKTFGATKALDNVSISLEPGKVRALVGENGAGKSTLFKVLAGCEKQDAGAITLDGRPYNPTTTAEAHAHGVVLVFQEITINPSLGVAENIFIDRMRRFNGPFGILNAKTMRKAAQQLLDEIGAGVLVSQDLARLDLGQWKIIEIARALSYEPQVLLLDESTAYLNTREVDALLKVIYTLRARQIALGFVSHHLDEVSKVADTITILKDGAWVGDFGVDELTTDEIGARMVGRAIGHDIYPQPRSMPPAAGPDAPLLRLQEVAIGGRLAAINLDLQRGEILGIGGLKGSGGEDILGVINGDLRGFQGQMIFEGKPYRPNSPADAWRSAIGYLPGSRTSEGLIVDFSVLENLTLASRPRKWIFRDQQIEKESGRKLMADLQIKATGPGAPCNSLSGGNMQKVVLGKCMAPAPKVLLLNNPTRGIDIGARIEIYRIIHELAQQGVAVILLSEDLSELIGLSDRIVITRVGSVSRQFASGEKPSEEEIVNYMV